MPHVRATITPRRVRTGMLTTAACTGPASIVLLTLWAVAGESLERPALAAAVVQILALACIGSLVGAAVVHCHIVVSYAFAAGVRYAQRLGQLPEDDDRPRRAVLRLIR